MAPPPTSPVLLIKLITPPGELLANVDAEPPRTASTLATDQS